MMNSHSLGISRDPAVSCPVPEAAWERFGFSGLEAIRPFIETIVTRMMDLSYSEDDVFGVRLAVIEAMANAVRHGHRNDPTKRAEVRFLLDHAGVRVIVEDRGNGFDVNAVPDPCAAENLERLSGRGLLLMRAFMTQVEFSGCGNRVTLYKRRSES